MITIRTTTWAAAAVAAVIGCTLATTVAVRFAHDDSRRHYLGVTGWPAHGQGAYQLADGPLEASPDERPAPIASLAKVMTAVLVLRAFPGARFALTVSTADVTDTARRRDEQQSVVEVRAGERLSGRQALAALLLPSANNIAVMLGRRVAGSVRAFVARMNRTARRLGMRQTTYTDPSGFDAHTRSTAADQVLLAGAALRLPLLRRLVDERSDRLPVAGTVHNTDWLLGRDGLAGLKTGSMDASGGCFMFVSHRRSGNVYGVVLGQHGHNLIDAGLYAGQQLVDRVAPVTRRGIPVGRSRS